MRRFRNILVGVDLAQSPRLSPLELGADNHEAVRRAIWLARHNGARLVFFSALHLPEPAQRLLTEEDRSRLTRTVGEAAREALAGLVREAGAQGVSAEATLASGRGWVEITRQVLREKHDLVLVGARHVRGIQRMLFGSTSAHLVRQCPGAVWVARAGPVSEPFRVLVATDFTPVADEAVRLGLALKEMEGAQVDVLHAVDFPLDRLWSTGLPDAAAEEYHAKVRVAAQQALRQQLQRVTEGAPLEGVGTHLSDLNALPDLAILRFIREYQIDLLVIGTIARGGLPGLVVGNTAERLLVEMLCSVLTVKPADFHCPLRLS